MDEITIPLNLGDQAQNSKTHNGVRSDRVGSSPEPPRLQKPSHQTNCAIPRPFFLETSGASKTLASSNFSTGSSLLSASSSTFSETTSLTAPAGTTLRKGCKASKRLIEGKREADPSAGLREYVLMCQREYAIPDTSIAILGRALFSSVPGARLTAVSNGLSDFCAIDGWAVEEHCQRHDGDLAWLNARVETMTRDPGRTVVVFTHHGPTENSRAVAPLHADSDIRSGFLTDLRGQPCWENAQVKQWAFGHTHYSCGFVDEETGKRVCTNQKGYSDGTLVAFREGNLVRIG